MITSLGLIMSTLLAVGNTTDFYIVPQHFDIDPEQCLHQYKVQPCSTLKQFSNKTGDILSNVSNVSLYFLPGLHNLSDNQDLILSSFKIVRAIRYCTNNCNTDTVINLRGKYIKIINVDEFSVDSLTFNNGYLQIGYVRYTFITGSTFYQNALYIFQNKDYFKNFYKHKVAITIKNSMFLRSNDGAITINTDICHMHITNCTFEYNDNNEGAGAIDMNANIVALLHISGCEFRHNDAEIVGGAIYIYAIQNGSIVNVIDSTFTDNTARAGSAIEIWNNKYLSVFNCTFSDNKAFKDDVFIGSTVYTESTIQPNSIEIKNSNFRKNYGGTVFIKYSSKSHIENTSFIDNRADVSGLEIFVTHSDLTINNINFTNNLGYLYGSSSKMYFTGSVVFTNSMYGAIGAVLCDIYFKSTEEIAITNNRGGFFVRESTLSILSPIKITGNRVAAFGGAIRSYLSTIVFKLETNVGDILITNNFAGQNGGGIYAISSLVKIFKSKVSIGSNIARFKGGGLYLGGNTKVYLLKDKFELKYETSINLEVTSNTALQGGGIYIADNSTGSYQCQGKKQSEDPNKEYIIQGCFISAPFLKKLNALNIFFTNNSAVSGSAIYGGLLDRCTTNALVDINGVANRLQESVMFPWNTISSEPVRVVFCDSYNASSMIYKRKGEEFLIHLSAVDQVGNPVNATVHSTVITASGVGRLKEGQTKRIVSNECTELKYNVFSQDSSALVEIYADGPCLNLGISKQTFSVTFLPCKCPIGFQPHRSEIHCLCECDKKLESHQILHCYPEDKAIQLEGNIWIGTTNSTNDTEFVISDCPFDYCVEKPLNISLSSPQQIDRQCANNRSGVLCGECERGLSLVLATSKCMECSNVFLFLIIPFVLAGLALVAFILLLNVTIATGNIHGLIFYANILAANKATFLSQNNFLTIFISWVNLDFGIETCFYDGMDSTAKVLLQLVFPAYLFLLMFLIITISKYSDSFSKLLSNRNPVAALGTLILLSYSKLIRFIIAALQSASLLYPEGSRQTVWLYNANIQYFTPRHIPQFVAAAIILILSGLFTVLLFFGQWLPRCSNWKLMKWTKNTKYTGFMDAYHAPFTPKHRYWVGLLLFTMIGQNLITAIARDTFLPVLSAESFALGLLGLKLLNNPIYQTWFTNSLETLFLLNVAFLASGTSYVSGTNGKQMILANISMAVAFSLFVVMICYHSYKFVLKSSKFTDLKNYALRKWQANNQQAMYHITNANDEEQFEVAHYVQQRDNVDPTTYADGTREVAGPSRLRSDQLRLSYIDDLAPITERDYRPAPLLELKML